MSEVPPEFRGLAGQLIREVKADDEPACRALFALHQPLLERWRRKPHSNLRDGTLTALAAAQRAIPRRFRLGLHTEIDRRGRRGLIMEVFLSATDLMAEDWRSKERALMVTGHSFEVTAKEINLKPIDFASVG